MIQRREILSGINCPREEIDSIFGLSSEEIEGTVDGGRWFELVVEDDKEGERSGVHSKDLYTLARCLCTLDDGYSRRFNLVSIILWIMGGKNYPRFR